MVPAFSGLHKGDFAASKMMYCVCAGVSGLQVCTFLPDRTEEVLKNSIQEDITQDKYLLLAPQ